MNIGKLQTSVDNFVSAYPSAKVGYGSFTNKDVGSSNHENNMSGDFSCCLVTAAMEGSTETPSFISWLTGYNTDDVNYAEAFGVLYWTELSSEWDHHIRQNPDLVGKPFIEGWNSLKAVIDPNGAANV